MASVNEMGFNQVAATLNAIQQQVTGQTEISPINNTQDFISVAQTTLKNGYDPVLNAISQMVSRTIFATRPYSRKFKGIFVDNAAYGGHVRKINYIDLPAVDDAAYNLTDATSTDMYEVRKAKTVQTNFYGYNSFSDFVTRFEDQLKNAFSGPDQLGEFWANLMVEWTNKHEQFHETMARTALINFIGGKLAGDTSNVIHLLTEYKAATGKTDLTAITVYQPENYKAFVQWMYARIATLTDMMTERSTKFHTNLDNDRFIMRHTPLSDQRVYIYSPARYQSQMMAIADTYHDNFLTLADNESVNFWQNIDKPDTISTTPSYLLPTGVVKAHASNIEQANVLGVIFDREAVGISTYSQSMNVTPFNARGRYWNLWSHFTDRYWNDFTENGIVLLLD
jgi:hypothetical protein